MGKEIRANYDQIFLLPPYRSTTEFGGLGFCRSSGALYQGFCGVFRFWGTCRQDPTEFQDARSHRGTSAVCSGFIAEGLAVVVPMPEATDKRWDKGEFQKSNFEYDEKRDVYICPLKEELTYERTRRKSHGKYLIRVYRCRHGSECPKRRQCSHDKRGRKVERAEHEWAVERQRVKQREPTKREILKKRKTIVEPVFAQIKEHGAFRRFSLRGLENVKTQWTLICTAFNMRKLYRHWTAGALVIN